jgi:3-deoxy-manno-octulosonate cytidylyltransferase (CMP-KDO synthetase)
MKYIGIIPARYASSRFPGKPLCDLNGKPMIQRTYESVMKWDKWEKVYVATDSNRIKDKCDELNIPCLMTSDAHTDCLDRASEVVDILESCGKGGDRYIVIQGDEPLFNSNTLNVDLTPEVVNFYTEVKEEHDLYNPNSVKVVISNLNKALYFSRYTIPYHNEKTRRTNQKLMCLKQIGVYSFSGSMLKKYTNLQPTYLENLEGIGLLRLLENDISIDMRYTEFDSVSIDTEDDRKYLIKELL